MSEPSSRVIFLRFLKRTEVKDNAGNLKTHANAGAFSGPPAFRAHTLSPFQLLANNMDLAAYIRLIWAQETGDPPENLRCRACFASDRLHTRIFFQHQTYFRCLAVDTLPLSQSLLVAEISRFLFNLCLERRTTSQIQLSAYFGPMRNTDI